MALSQTTSGLLASLSEDLAAAVHQAGRSVVAVHGRRRLPGSGLALRDDQVVTASHVLERDSDLSITDPDGKSHPARLIGRDASTDLAVLSVPGAGLPSIERSPTRSLVVGNLVLAVGRPGTPDPIASFGVVSSLGFTWRTAQGGVLDAFIRADVSLLPGLSGGALADVRGRVVGLLSTHVAGGEPIAVPIESVERIVQRILSGGTLRRAYLGVSSQPVELQASLRSGLAIEQTSGLMLLGLEPDAPAERGGLLAGDIVLSIGGRTIEDGEALQMALGPDSIGKSTLIQLIRAGQQRELSVTPAARPN